MRKRNLITTLATLLAILTVSACAGTYEPEQPAGYVRAPFGTEESDFYGALAPYGDWIRSDRYGLVWSPYDKLVDWRPYTDGEWVWTDYGWAWAANEDWGWATYHYGRWYDDPYDGWCWVPGRQWAPAWVAWREGGGWVGWAPLPPELAWGNGGWQGNNDWDHLPGVEHYWWSFCRDRDLPGPGIIRRLAPRHRAVVLIGETRNITDYDDTGSRFANRSLDVAAIRRASGKKIETRRIADLAAPPVDHRDQLSRGTYRAYRPQLKGPAAGSEPPNVRQSHPEPTKAEEAIRTTPVVREPRDAEARALRQRELADRERMQRDQLEESRQRAAGIDADRLRRQQENEQKALSDQSERDQRVLRSRQENNPRGAKSGPANTQRPPRKTDEDGK
jgi:hypothetical protein